MKIRVIIAVMNTIDAVLKKGLFFFFFRLYFHYCLSSVHTCEEQSRLQNKTGWKNGKMFAHQTFPHGPGLNKGIKPIYPRVVNNDFVRSLTYK